ncbi:MAG: 16S rRNA (cytosine(1402)-N(4))-methyltransferase RsmH [candidate division NC10 bacterium]|nr:16S rRNA (cytosine(1402)-N(4))-methyltransferase RsmH [candidate division NC10 bacterium]
MPPVHLPVLAAEVLACLLPRSGGRYLDATVGAGGHAVALLEASAPAGVLVGIDCDPEALRVAGERLAGFGPRVRLLHGRHEALTQLLDPAERFDGILFDLGASALQLDTAERGFSFAREGPLDMRMDPTRGPTAAELLERLPEQALADLIYRWGEERFSRRLARAVVEARREAPVLSTTALAALVARAIPRGKWPRKIHPATRTFQALRIAVNEELTGLAAALTAAAGFLGLGGRLVAISFHSLEDRIVKHTWRTLEAAGRVRVLTRRPIIPGDAEMDCNPRARSAKLRALEYLPEAN